jgi:hypothetical protein
VVSEGPAWSSDTGQADWIGDRLAPFFGNQVTSVIPGGFAAYARLLHPAEEPLHGGDRVVRWREVAAWSGAALEPGAQFHEIALPPVRPATEAPWRSQGPYPGSLYPPDAAALAGILRAWTTTPERCWFCVWDGYGWDGGVALTASDDALGDDAPDYGAPGVEPDPVPAAVRDGGRVELPHREYLLYRGPVEAALATVGLGDEDQVANLWWPQDRAWCVATEIDLAWTYVGGSAGLIAALLADPRIEALPAAPDDALTGVADWVTEAADDAAGRLLAGGPAMISTSRGTVRATLQHGGRGEPGWLLVTTAGENGVAGSSSGRVGGPPGLRREISERLASEIIALVGG